MSASRKKCAVNACSSPRLGFGVAGFSWGEHKNLTLWRRLVTTFHDVVLARVMTGSGMLVAPWTGQRVLTVGAGKRLFGPPGGVSHFTSADVANVELYYPSRNRVNIPAAR